MKPRSASVTAVAARRRLRDEQLQRVGDRAAGADQQLDDRVDRRRVGGLEVDHRQHRGELVAEQLRAHRAFARPHPVAVAGQRVDLAVVGDHPVGVGELPAREGVGREARVHQAEGRLGALVAELGEEVLELGRAQHALVDEGAGGEGDDLQLRRRRSSRPRGGRRRGAARARRRRRRSGRRRPPAGGSPACSRGPRGRGRSGSTGTSSQPSTRSPRPSQTSSRTPSSVARRTGSWGRKHIATP